MGFNYINGILVEVVVVVWVVECLFFVFPFQRSLSVGRYASRVTMCSFDRIVQKMGNDKSCESESFHGSYDCLARVASTFTLCIVILCVVHNVEIIFYYYLRCQLSPITTCDLSAKPKLLFLIFHVLSTSPPTQHTHSRTPLAGPSSRCVSMSALVLSLTSVWRMFLMVSDSFRHRNRIQQQNIERESEANQTFMLISYSMMYVSDKVSGFIWFKCELSWWAVLPNYAPASGLQDIRVLAAYAELSCWKIHRRDHFCYVRKKRILSEIMKAKWTSHFNSKSFQNRRQYLKLEMCKHNSTF